jgi:hypothetical protein
MIAIPNVLITNEAEEMVGDATIGGGEVDLVCAQKAMLADARQGDKGD